MAESYIQLPADGSGKRIRTRERTISATVVQEQYVIPVSEKVVSYSGRAATYRTPGRAGTVGQKILSIWNGSSSVLVDVHTMSVDLYQTAVKAVSVAPPIIRVHRVTAAPTNGSTLSKVATDNLQSSDASVAVLGDASADGTGSGTTLTATVATTTILSQEYAPRLITAAGYEPADRIHFFPEDVITLRQSEGVVMFLNYTAATQNPVTDMWIAGVQWDEYTIP